MSMKEWAEKEVALVMDKLSEDTQLCMSDCYKYALNAFNSLLDDGHSGCNIDITKTILNRLMNNLPLTAITDTEDMWTYCRYIGGCEAYQCVRYSGLFKYVFDNGKIEYSDIHRCAVINIENHITPFGNDLAIRILDEMFPITMPYYPSTVPIKVYCEDWLTNPDNGDYDTFGILYAIFPDPVDRNDPKSVVVPICRYFKEDDEGMNMVEIEPDEYDKRRQIHIKREEAGKS